MAGKGEGRGTSSQRRLGPQGVKTTALFPPWGPSLHWGDGVGSGIAK